MALDRRWTQSPRQAARMYFTTSAVSAVAAVGPESAPAAGLRLDEGQWGGSGCHSGSPWRGDRHGGGGTARHCSYSSPASRGHRGHCCRRSVLTHRHGCVSTCWMLFLGQRRWEERPSLVLLPAVAADYPVGVRQSVVSQWRPLRPWTPQPSGVPWLGCRRWVAV